MEGEHPQTVADAAAADPEGFATALWDRHASPLLGTALRILRQREDAEDVVQEALIATVAKPPAILTSALPAWLHRVVVNRCLDRLRRERRRGAENLSPFPPAAAGSSPSPRRIDLQRAVAALPERARLVFVLHDVEGLQHAEIAALLGISVGTSKSQLFRARDLLRHQLEGARPRASARVDEE